MDELSKEYVISFFNTQLSLHGDKPEAVRWTKRGQYLHYRSLLDIGDIKRSKILDFGCGKGDFYEFLREKGIIVDYTGYDINEKLIRLAQEKYPDCKFQVFDIDKEELTEDFDYIFLCGVFNLKVQGLAETIKDVLIKLFKHCKIALAYNGLSAHNPKKDFELYYSYPEDLFSFIVKNLTPYVSVRHDRIKYDFTIFVYKEPNFFSG
ncbi:MAG: class I SAM-dependent methyltransferase [Thermodesulfovibrionales bacterium]|nr:class I SAM-dependent methyltransferase [Thermodesulfovibrionales bacterium]